MKFHIAAVSLILSPFAQADVAYQSVEEYVDSVTNRDTENYVCHVSSDYPKYRGCSLGSFYHQPGIVVGILESKSDSSSFVFVLAPKQNGQYYLAEKSLPFSQLDGYAIGVEELSVESNGRFHIQFTSFTRGTAARPDSDIYRFKLIKGKWRVAEIDHRTLARCDDGSIGDGDSYSANFLTGKLLIKKFKNCKAVATKKHWAKFPVFQLVDFVPLDSKYMVISR